jgi:hypothetical protein
MMAGEGRFKAKAGSQRFLDVSLNDEGKAGLLGEKKAA